MRLVDPRMSGIDDYEHFGREIGALAIKQNTRNLDSIDLIRMFLAEKMQSSKAMLPIDDEILPVRLTQKADAFGRIRAAKAQGFIGEKQDRAGNKRLTDRRLVEVDDLTDFSAVQQALERFFALFYAGNKPCHLVVAGFIRLDV